MSEHVSEHGAVVEAGAPGVVGIDDGLRPDAKQQRDGEDGETEEQKETGAVGEAPGGDGHGKPSAATLWVNSAAGLPGCVEALTAARDRSADEQAS